MKSQKDELYQEAIKFQQQIETGRQENQRLRSEISRTNKLLTFCFFLTQKIEFINSSNPNSNT
jgi:hypothetical protein